MDFNNSLFGMPFITGFVFIIAGFITYKFPPKKINMLYGYRTSASMKNQKRWDFAQKYSSKLSLLLGGILLASSLLGFVFKVSIGKGVIIGTLELIILVIMMFLQTEKAIKQQFKNEE